jgi:alginate O-acetyltransferase complex protein AlgF
MKCHARSIVLALAVCATPAAAQDNQLYEEPADPNASFVRVVAPGETVAVVGNETFENVVGGVTPYVMTTKATISVALGNMVGDGEIPPTSFFTFVEGNDGTLHLLQDNIENSPAKADLVFYNLSDLSSVDLFVPRVGAMALDNVAQHTSRQVALKAPLTLDFEVREGDAVLATLPAVRMRRRAGVTVVFSGVSGDYTAFSTENLYFN